MSAPSSWVPGADGSAPSLDGLAYGIVSRDGDTPRVGVRLGDLVVDAAELADAGLLHGVCAEPAALVRSCTLNPLMAAGPRVWSAWRERLIELLREGAPARAAVEPCLHPLSDLAVHLPVEVADYIDFYSSREHATNLGRILRPGEAPLLDNWHHLPVGYHGRAGTIVASGAPVPRPHGQRRPQAAGAPTFGPSERLDFELEVGFLVGTPSERGHPVPVQQATEHLFGVVMLNDWSARDLQAWEYRPLGPLLGKSFATSISAWVLPLAALETSRVPGPVQDPPVLPHLRSPEPRGFDVELTAALRTEAMRRAGTPATTIGRTNLRTIYWDPAQHVAHATSNGAALRCGDLHGSGTVSGATPGSFGSLIELTENGERPLELPGGERRTFLQDGDEVVLRGIAAGGGPALGEVTGVVRGGRAS